MKMNWAMKGIVLGAILLQGLAVAPPSPMIPLGESVTILEGSSIHVAGAGVRIDVHAVGVLWYVDGQQAVFAELTVTCRGEKIEQTVKLGRPVVIQDLQIEMLAGNFRHHCTLRVRRIDASPFAWPVANN